MTNTSRYEAEADSTSDTNTKMMESMLYKEQTIYAQHDYFALPLPVSPDEEKCELPVDPLCRHIMAKWCRSLCKFCSYDRRMVESIMSCVDRFVATTDGSRILLSRDEYQLAVMTSLYLMSKIQQTQALEPESVAKLSRGKYSKANIEAMELRILCSLDWFVNPPTTMAFAEEFLNNFDLVPTDESDESSSSSSSFSSRSSNTEERIIDLVRCQLEEAVCDYELSCLTRPSHVAYGALANALESLSIDSSDSNNAMKRLKHQLQVIDEEFISTSLLKIVSSSEESELSSLLLDRCSGNDNGKKSNRNHQEGKKPKGSPLFGRRSSSSITASPRTVVVQ